MSDGPACHCELRPPAEQGEAARGKSRQVTIGTLEYWNVGTMGFGGVGK